MSYDSSQTLTQPPHKFTRNSDEGLTLSEIWELLHARKSLILSAGIVVAFFTLVYHVLRPSYEAKTSLLVQRAQNSPLQAMMGKMAGAPMLTTGKNNEYQEKFAAYLDSHEFRLSAARKMLDTPEYASDSSRLTHRGILSRVWKALWYVQITDPESKDAKLEELARALRVVQFVKSGFDNIVVQTKLSDYAMAVRLVNFMSGAAVDVIAQRELAELDSAKHFLENQMAQSLQRLQDVDATIVDFRKRSQSVTTDLVPHQIVGNLGGLKENFKQNQLKFELNKKLIALLEKELKQDQEEILGSGAKSTWSSDVVEQLSRKIQDLRYRRMFLIAQGDSEKSSDIVAIDESSAELAQQLRSEIARSGGNEGDMMSLLKDRDGLIEKIHTLKRENQYLESQADTLKRAITDAKAPLQAMPQEMQTLAGFNRNAQLEFNLFGQMKNRILDLEIEKLSLASKIRVVERATIAGVSPRLNFLPKMMIAFLFTCFFGAILAYAVEFMDTTVKNRNDLIALGLVHLGSVPLIPESLMTNWKRASYRLTQWKVFRVRDVNSTHSWLHNPDAPEVMAFNHLRARLGKLRGPQGERAKLIAVTSSKQGEGKSYVSSNLAFSLSQLGGKSLLIDCDLRRSHLDKSLGFSRDLGLTSHLVEKRSLEECLVVNFLPGLDLLPTGASVKRPTELISSAKFSQLVNKLREHYDYIILDTPPLLPVVDSVVIANLADAVVLVTSYRKSQLNNLLASIEKLESADKQTIYAVLNQAPKVQEYVYVSRSFESKPKANDDVVTGQPFDIKSEIQKFRDTLPSGSV